MDSSDLYEDDIDSSELDSDFEDGFSDESEKNGRTSKRPAPINFSEDEENDFFDDRIDPIGDDVYEIEWELDLVPKRVVPKSNPQPLYNEPTHSKKDRKSRDSKKDKKKSKKSRRNQELDEQEHRHSSHRHHRHSDRNEKTSRKHRSHKSHRNQDESEERTHRHRHRHHHANGLDQSNEVSLGW